MLKVFKATEINSTYASTMGSSQSEYIGPAKFGRELRERHFLFDPSYRNLNHGMHRFLTHQRAL